MEGEFLWDVAVEKGDKDFGRGELHGQGDREVTCGPGGPPHPEFAQRHIMLTRHPLKQLRSEVKKRSGAIQHVELKLDAWGLDVFGEVS